MTPKQGCAGTQRLAYDSGHRGNVFQARAMPGSSLRVIVSCAADGQVCVCVCLCVRSTLRTLSPSPCGLPQCCGGVTTPSFPRPSQPDGLQSDAPGPARLLSCLYPMSKYGPAERVVLIGLSRSLGHQVCKSCWPAFHAYPSTPTGMPDMRPGGAWHSNCPNDRFGAFGTHCPAAAEHHALHEQHARCAI